MKKIFLIATLYFLIILPSLIMYINKRYIYDNCVITDVSLQKTICQSSNFDNSKSEFYCYIIKVDFSLSNTLYKKKQIINLDNEFKAVDIVNSLKSNENPSCHYDKNYPIETLYLDYDVNIVHPYNLLNVAIIIFSLIFFIAVLCKCNRIHEEIDQVNK